MSCLFVVSCVVQARTDYYFIALPNALGVVFNTVSLLLCVVLPARDRRSSDDVGMEDGRLKRLLQSVRGGSRVIARRPASSQESADLTIETASQHSDAAK